MLTVTDCASATFLRFSAVIFCFNNEFVSIFPLTKSSRSQAKIGVKGRDTVAEVITEATEKLTDE